MKLASLLYAGIGVSIYGTCRLAGYLFEELPQDLPKPVSLLILGAIIVSYLRLWVDLMEMIESGGSSSVYYKLAYVCHQCLAVALVVMLTNIWPSVMGMSTYSAFLMALIVHVLPCGKWIVDYVKQVDELTFFPEKKKSAETMV